MLVLKSHFQVSAQAASSEQQHLMTQLAEKLHSHIFRATGATLMAAAGMDHIRLSLLLGHANPEATQRYYLAAEYLELPQEVKLICLRIQRALETTQESSSAFAYSPFGWYERKGYDLAGKGGTNGHRSAQR